MLSLVLERSVRYLKPARPIRRPFASRRSISFAPVAVLKRCPKRSSLPCRPSATGREQDALDIALGQPGIRTDQLHRYYASRIEVRLALFETRRRRADLGYLSFVNEK